MKPKLYQYTACPFCNKVRSALEFKGVAFEAIEVHPLKKSEIEFSKDYRAVPIYIDSAGKQVNDSTPIMRRIDEELFQGTDEEAVWLGWSEKLVKGLPTAIYNTTKNALQSFNYITKIGKFNWLEKLTIKYLGAFVMTLVAKKIKKREQIDDPIKFLKTMASEWADGVDGRPFMGGSEPNAADIAVFGITRPVEDLEAGKILNDNPAFSEWRNRVKEKVSKTAGVPLRDRLNQRDTGRNAS